MQGLQKWNTFRKWLYLWKNDKNTTFLCETCKKETQSDIKLKLISKKIKKEDELRNRIANKFSNFIENNGKIPNNDFYIENLNSFKFLYVWWKA